MSKRMSRGGGPKTAPPRSPAPTPSGPAVGASGFTDSGVSQHAIDAIAANSRTGGAANASGSAGGGSSKYYDKFEGSSTLERLYGRKDESDCSEVIYGVERYAPLDNKAALIRKLETIAAGGSKA